MAEFEDWPDELKTCGELSCEDCDDRTLALTADRNEWQRICDEETVRAEQAEAEVLTLNADLAELRELATWMTGCGYEFTQHTFFTKSQHLLVEQELSDAVDAMEVSDE